MIHTVKSLHTTRCVTQRDSQCIETLNERSSSTQTPLVFENRVCGLFTFCVVNNRKSVTENSPSFHKRTLQSNRIHSLVEETTAIKMARDRSQSEKNKKFEMDPVKKEKHVFREVGSLGVWSLSSCKPGISQQSIFETLKSRAPSCPERAAQNEHLSGFHWISSRSSAPEPPHQSLMRRSSFHLRPQASASISCETTTWRPTGNRTGLSRI